MDTLPDIVAADMRLLSIGLNPSLPSVAAGFYFANPRNRFWKALNASALISDPVQPGPGAMQVLLAREGIGFTDLVKRPSRGAGDLRAADYRAGAPRLQAMIERYRPRYAWFHGKLAYTNFIRYTDAAMGQPEWGLQQLRLGRTSLFVSPNPSPANAVYSLDDLLGWYNELARRMGVA